MLEMVNLSRLSHGVRASAMMRRCLNETMAVARNRIAFGKTIVHHPLMRRQIMKTLLPTEQALSMFMFTASVMEKADAGDERAERVLRIITPLLKYRTCRDNIKVATAAMEARGGNGYIELCTARCPGSARAARTGTGRPVTGSCRRSPAS